MNNRLLIPSLLLCISFLVDIYLQSVQSEYRLFSKALLMPMLIWMFNGSKPGNTPSAYLINAGLLFSWMGDILLQFDRYNPLFFIAGLSTFLLTHLCYIVYLIRIEGEHSSFLKKRPVMLLAVVAYTIELLFILWPGLQDMKIPVTVYALVISTMFAAAAWKYGQIDDRPAFYLIGGSFLFVMSDSLLAVNKFLRPIPFSGFLVMSTYVAAQWLIIRGAISYHTLYQLSSVEKNRPNENHPYTG
jgi:uncharacterized membrane protein YhhN